MSRVQIFRPSDYDRELLERAREVIKFARKVLAESDPSALPGCASPNHPRSASKAGLIGGLPTDDELAP
jgi:hypothetical protein